MTTHQITITYPDDQANTILNALKSHISLSLYAEANTEAITTQEALAQLDDQARELTNRIVKNELKRQAEEGTAQIDIT